MELLGAIVKHNLFMANFTTLPYNPVLAYRREI